ncbi:glycosyltransferase family 25 protein [Buttiauxella noackiae]|uniref:glycosyltransferase family 25 protein n=1 Tax=Buttiauxella noackiae TaxID=82992 RepID=UPI0005575138|nr:glycosyltransferase family 25 protein [Buttiauxella noackiae]
MRVFIISLESEQERRRKISLQCKEQSLLCEFINAIDGRKLPSEIATTVTHDFYNSKLTRGEIGCALSHLNIYSKMVSENICHALVLEDDAIFDDSLHECLSGVDGIIREDKPEIFILTARCSYNKHIKKTDFSGRNYFRITNGSGGYGYIINLPAAKLLLERNLPIKFEADRWTIFRDIAGLNVWCTKVPVIRHACVIDDKSTIGSERISLAEDRGQVINKLKREIPFYQLKRIKNIILNKSGISN